MSDTKPISRPRQQPQASIPWPIAQLRHMHQNDVAERWGISPRTLERWRWLNQGPVYLKLVGIVVYRLEDIEEFEAKQVRAARAALGLATLTRAEQFAQGLR